MVVVRPAAGAEGCSTLSTDAEEDDGTSLRLWLAPRSALSATAVDDAVVEGPDERRDLEAGAAIRLEVMATGTA